MDDDAVELVLVLLLLLQLVVLERKGGDKSGLLKETTAGDESGTASAT